jgi:hypothetical protein
MPNRRKRLEEYKKSIKWRKDIRVTAPAFLGNTTPIEHQCTVCGFNFKENPDRIKAGKGRCKSCRLGRGIALKINKMKEQYPNRRIKTHQFMIEKVRERFKFRNLTLLSKRYVNNSALLKYSCDKCGFVGKTSLSNLRLLRPTACTRCNLTLQRERRLREIHADLRRRGLELISDFKGDNKKIKVRCKCCRACHESLLRTILSWKQNCLYCMGSRKKKELSQCIESASKFPSIAKWRDKEPSIVAYAYRHKWIKSCRRAQQKAGHQNNSRLQK